MTDSDPIWSSNYTNFAAQHNESVESHTRQTGANSLIHCSDISGYKAIRWCYQLLLSGSKDSETAR